MTNKVKMIDTISEAASKKKRGRPPIMSAASKQMTDFAAGEVKTHRGKMDIMYRLNAIKLLTNDDNPERFHWIIDGKKCEVGDSHGWKRGILSELGRIGNHDYLKSLALEICELKPKTKAAIAMIRRARLGREDKPNVQSLATSIETALNAYIAVHPTTPMDMIIRALRSVADLYEEGQQYIS